MCSGARTRRRPGSIEPPAKSPGSKRPPVPGTSHMSCPFNCSRRNSKKLSRERSGRLKSKQALEQGAYIVRQTVEFKASTLLDRFWLYTPHIVSVVRPGSHSTWAWSAKNRRSPGLLGRVEFLEDGQGTPRVMGNGRGSTFRWHTMKADKLPESPKTLGRAS